MAVPILSDQQYEEVRQFFNSDAANLIFLQLEHGVITDWANEDNSSKREHCWNMLQALLALKVHLRNAATNRRLSEHVRERQAYQA